MTGNPPHVGIVGAGLVGSLLSIFLVRRGYRVSVFERRPDMRTEKVDAGRSINLALSSRGIRALREVGLAEAVQHAAIPMHGRMMHDRLGKLTFQPYGKEGQFINSISRSDLNIVLINAAEKAGVEFHFEQRCKNVDLTKTEITFETSRPQHSPSPSGEGKSAIQAFDLIVGADGAFSSVREAMQRDLRFSFSMDSIEHGYKEFHIPAGSGGATALEKNALHIWPRESFMMIALPNPDGSFTCTLFFPMKGIPSFESFSSIASVKDFFVAAFPDVVNLMPGYLADYETKPASSLATLKVWPWVRNKTLLIGDAAHAIVPFYGQGMNAGFEDCRILNQLLDQHNDDWNPAIVEFQRLRKPDTDAIAHLALDNFVEMRDQVADDRFLLQKKIEAKLHELFPDKWIPLYSMVTFYDTVRYGDALTIGRRQKEIMSRVMKTPEIASRWTSLNFQEIVNQL